MASRGALCFAAAAAMTAALAAPAPARAGSYFYANALFIRDIIPGTEQVRIIPGGDFEEAPAPPLWAMGTRWENRWPDGTPHIMTVPGVCGQRSWNRAGAEMHDIRREPLPYYDWRVYFSGYGWLPSAGRLRTSGQAPGNRGEQHVCVVWPVLGGDAAAMTRGFYFFGDVSSGNCSSVWVPNWNTKGGLDDPKMADNQHRYGYWDHKGRWQSVNIGGDNYGDTPAVEFAPPVIRHAAVADFTDYLLADARAKVVVKSRDFDAAAAVAALGRVAGADPKDAQAQNALAAACIVKFARDLDDLDACKQALAAWDASLAADAHQPNVRYWRRQYGGYLPPVVYHETTPPPPEAIAASEKAEAEMDPAQRQCSYLLMRDIVPGTERVKRVPGGGFEAGLAGWTVPPDHPGFAAGTPEGLLPDRNPIQPYRGKFLFVEAPLPDGKTAEVLSKPLDLPAGEYVLSAFLSPSAAGFNIAHGVNARSVLSYLTIGIEGGKALFWGMPSREGWRVNEGLFVFTTIHLARPVAGRRLRIATGPWFTTGDPKKTPPHPTWRDADGRGHRVAMLIDNVALTPAGEFRPPVLRTGAQMMLHQCLALDRSAVEGPAAEAMKLIRRDRQGDLPKAVGLLASAAKAEPDCASWNRLAAAAMAQFLRDATSKDFHAMAIAAWDASLALRPDQPHVRLWRDLLGRWEPVAGAVRMEFLYPNAYVARIAPQGGTAKPGDKLKVTIEAT